MGLTRRIAAVALAAALPATIAACGGGSSSVDPQQVLHETFSNPKSISSGKLGVDVSVDVQGSQGGTFTAAISGPFQSGGARGSLPQFDLTGKLSGSASGLPALSVAGGLVFTSDNAYVEYQGTSYRLPHPWFAQLQALVAQAARAPGPAQGISSVFSSLGIRPADWFTNLTDEGTTDVEGAETNHIAGDVDVAKVAKDLGKLSQLSQQIPGQTQKLTPRRLQQLKQSVRGAHVDIYSGTSDHLLRKLSVSLDLVPPRSSGNAGFKDLGIDFSLTLSDLNQHQTIATPPNARPLPPSFLRGLQSVGTLGSSAFGAASGGSTGSAGAGASAGGLQQQYLRCVQQRGGGAPAINKCIQELYG